MANRILLWIGFSFALFPLFGQKSMAEQTDRITGPAAQAKANNKDSILYFFTLADAGMDQDKYDSAEYWLAKVGDRLVLNRPGVFNYYYHSRQAEIFYYNNLLQLGLQQATRAIQTAQELRDSLFIADAYNFLGLFSLNLEKYRDAENYLLKGLRFMSHPSHDTHTLALSEAYHLHGNLGEVYTKLKRFDLAQLHFDSSRLKAAEKKALRAEALALISAGDAYLETGEYDAAISRLGNGVEMALANQDHDVALFGNGVLSVLYAKSGNTAQTYGCLQKGNLLRKNQPGLNPFYSLLYLRKAAEALDLLQDYRGVATMQNEIMKTEQAVRRKNNLMIENVLSAGLKNENKLLQLEVQEARQKQKANNNRTIGLLLLIGLLVLGGLYYRKSIRQKLLLAGIREKISQNLHDDIGASISSLHIYSSIAQHTLATQPEKTRELLEQITEQSGILMENMSDMVWSMRAHGDEGMGLGTRIKNFGAELLTIQNIQCRYEIDEEAFRLFNGFESRKNILLIIKEAMNNIAKYSAATQAVITLKKESDRWINILIHDNGGGFDMQNMVAGNGLKNMRARVKELKGNITIMSAPGAGTTITANIPIP